MARPIMTFEFNNKSECKFTDYQSLLFKYIIGSIMLEHDSSFIGGRVDVTTDYHVDNEELIISFKGLNLSLLSHFLDKFPFTVGELRVSEGFTGQCTSVLVIGDFKIKRIAKTVTTLEISK